jgi:DHA2 family multidrug resistance protein
MLDTGKDADWFSSPAIVAEMILAVAGFCAWLIWELTAEHPIVDLSLFKQRNFVVAVIALCVGFAVFFGNSLLLPLWLQTQMGYMATWAGLAAAPGGVVAIIVTPFAAQLTNKVDARWVASFSFAAFAASFFMRSLYTPDADFLVIIAPMVLQGFGMATFFIAMISISLNGVRPQQVPQATGLTNFARITAGSFAASIATTVWDRGEATHQTRLAETMASSSPVLAQTMDKLQAAGLSAQQAAGAVGQQVVHQAFHLATIDFFRISSWLLVAVIPLIWLTKSTIKRGSTPAD